MDDHIVAIDCLCDAVLKALDHCLAFDLPRGNPSLTTTEKHFRVKNLLITCSNSVRMRLLPPLPKTSCTPLSHSNSEGDIIESTRIPGALKDMATVRP